MSSTTVEASMTAGVSKGLVISTLVEVLTTSGIEGGVGAVAAGGRGADDVEPDFQKKFLEPREALRTHP